MMHNEPYLIQLIQAGPEEDAAQIVNIVQRAMQDVGNHLQLLLQHFYVLDLPFVVAALEMVAANCKITMCPEERKLTEDIKQLVVCTTVDLGSGELYRQAQELRREIDS